MASMIKYGRSSLRVVHTGIPHNIPEQTKETGLSPSAQSDDAYNIQGHAHEVKRALAVFIYV